MSKNALSVNQLKGTDLDDALEEHEITVTVTALEFSVLTMLAAGRFYDPRMVDKVVRWSMLSFLELDGHIGEGSVGALIQQGFEGRQLADVEAASVRQVKRNKKRVKLSLPQKEFAGKTTHSWKVWAWAIKQNLGMEKVNGDSNKWSTWDADAAARGCGIKQPQAYSGMASLRKHDWIDNAVGSKKIWKFTEAAHEWLMVPANQKVLILKDVLDAPPQDESAMIGEPEIGEVFLNGTAEPA